MAGAVQPSTKIAEAFDDFLRHVFPGTLRHVSEQQLGDLKMAFFGGATALFHALYDGIGDEDTPEAEAREIAMMDALEAELHAYAISLEEGKSD